ncbi:MAG: Brp/Blh family beta-carotene 15,15'-dioxygenase [Opitutales bacterium]
MSDAALERERLILRGVGLAGFVALAGAMTLTTLMPSLPAWLLYLPFLISVVLFGLPHGAVDHLVAAQLSGQRGKVRAIAGICLVYLVVALLVMGLWWLAPVFCGIGFLLLTLWHWGTGDLYWLMRRGAIKSDEISLAAAAVLLRGGVPVLLPFLFWPQASMDVVRSLVGLFDSPIALPLAVPLTGQVVIGAAFVLVGSFYIYRKYAPKDNFRSSRSNHIDLLELAALLVFFALTPPIFAVGIYFVFWHSLRHLARLLIFLEPGNKPSSPQRVRIGRREVRALAWNCLPMTLAAILLTLGLGLLVQAPGAQAEQWLALYLVFISSVTVPHALIVAWMDVHDAGAPIFSNSPTKISNLKGTEPCLN